MTSGETLKQKARALVPVLSERAERTRAARRILDETISDFSEASFWRMLQPRRFGGLEVTPKDFFQVQSILGEACPSSAWVMGVVSVHSWQLALFEPQAQDEVWHDDSSALIASSYAPTGKVEAVDGGYRVHGRWSFSSGCDACDWIFLGGLAPEMRTFLLPRADYRIEDNWQVAGLAGTGSKDIVVEDAFVPKHRTHELMDGFRSRSPGNKINSSALYRIPFGQIFVRSVSTTAIGIAQGALDAFLKVARERVAASDSGRVALDPTAQSVCAEATLLISDVRAKLFSNCDELMDYAERDERMPLEQRLRFRLDSANAVRRCAEAVDALFAASGGRAIFNDSPILPYFLDIHAAQAHFANRTDKPTRNLGAFLLGAENQDFFL
jgi:3-hydroxy-9,10-secoandrosta-1,3,5(10)-triene-9,17-dione monooxygenase